MWNCIPFFVSAEKRKTMNKKEIINRILDLTNLRLERAIERLNIEDIDNFTYHLVKDLEKSLERWEYIKST